MPNNEKLAKQRSVIVADSFIEQEYARGVPRSYGCPPSTLPKVPSGFTLTMRHTFLIALDRSGIQ
jgi:hypothetical protein